MYGTVTEGTPVSPPFETPEELAAYLSKHGDFWDQKRLRDGDDRLVVIPSYDDALKFVTGGWSPTAIIRS